MTEPIKIGILEDDTRMRHYLEMVLGDEQDTDVVFAADRLSQAKTALEGNQWPDVCLVDIQLPDGVGTDFIKHLKAKGDSKALILTILGDRVSVVSAIEAGADGYLLKDSSPQLIIDSVKDVAGGANPMSAQASSHLLNLLKDKQAISLETQSPLTDRETDVLTLFAKGMSYKETADILSISHNTVKEYVKSIYTKIEVSSRSEAVFEAIKAGWIKL